MDLHFKSTIVLSSSKVFPQGDHSVNDYPFLLSTKQKLQTNEGSSTTSLKNIESFNMIYVRTTMCMHLKTMGEHLVHEIHGYNGGGRFYMML
jgi:hypothetical protein